MRSEELFLEDFGDVLLDLTMQVVEPLEHGRILRSLQHLAKAGFHFLQIAQGNVFRWILRVPCSTCREAHHGCHDDIVTSRKVVCTPSYVGQR